MTGTNFDFIVILGIGWGVLLLCIPFYIFRIRNEVIKIRKILYATIGVDVPGINPQVKFYPKCHAKNRMEDYSCIACGQAV